MKIKLVGENAKLPQRKTPGASCWDAYARDARVLEPRKVEKIPLGFAVEVPSGMELQIRPRSGLFADYGIHVHLGTIDSDYRGEVCALVMNLSDRAYYVGVGDRIAQAALCPVVIEGLEIVENLSETERGTGGFGHTGLKQ